MSSDGSMFDAGAQQESEELSSSSFDDLYRILLFLLSLYVAGDLLFERFFRIVPSLVGQIVMGILWGPYLWPDAWFNLPSPGVWITIGDFGLVLLLCQAGLEMDIDTLKAVGIRGAVMAVVGSMLPIGLGILIGLGAMGLPWEEAIVTGCSFGPTSAGIAMNVLQQCGILQSPIGQLVVAIAIVDDMLALVVLSQLSALTGDGDLDVAALIIPIISALLWLVVGGFFAVYLLPPVLQKLRDATNSFMNRFDDHKEAKKREQHTERSATINASSMEERDDDEDAAGHSYNHMWHILALLVISFPATFYSQASYLMGAFLTGLATRHDSAASDYNDQLGQIIPWLMRIFFATSIAFQIPVTLFNDPQVIGNGFLLSLALLGKIAIGPLLTPVLLSTGKRWDRNHIRDCCIVGFSMAGEAEFAFLVARFGSENGLLRNETYASINFAILLSTIVSPVLLRVTLAIFDDTPAANEIARISETDNNRESPQDIKEAVDQVRPVSIDVCDKA